MYKKLINASFLKFILVGIVNTLFGTGIMFLFYNCFHFGYWISSASNYIFGSVLSYFLNKNFTFRQKKSSIKTILLFTANITICYLLAYGFAKPLAKLVLSELPINMQDNTAMLVGMCLFVILNYLGQKLIVFK